jgi:SecD/SecF fusion protein
MNIIHKSVLIAIGVTVLGFLYLLQANKKTPAYNAELLLYADKKLNDEIKNEIILNVSERAYLLSHDSKVGFIEGNRLKVQINNLKDTTGLTESFTGSSMLEIWELYQASEIMKALEMADRILNQKTPIPVSVDEPDDTTASEGLLSKLKEVKEATHAEIKTGLYKYFLPENYYYGASALIGFIKPADTAIIFPVFRDPKIDSLFPLSIKFVLGKPDAVYQRKDSAYLLYALKTYNRPDRPFLSDKDISEARQDFNPIDGKPTVTFKFKPGAAKIWEQMTERSTNRSIALMIDGIVFSAPTVREKITGGSVEIAGNFTISEAKAMTLNFNSGRLPVTLSLINKKITYANSLAPLKTFLLLTFCFLFSGGVAYLLFRQLKPIVNK